MYFVILVHVSLVRSQSRSHTGIPRTSTRKGSRQRGAPSITGNSFYANNGGSKTRTKTKQGDRPSWNMNTWTNDRSRQRIPKPPPQNNIHMQQWSSPFSYRSVSDDMYLNPAKHPPVLVRDGNSNGRSVPKSRPLKSKIVKKATTPKPAEVNQLVEEPFVPLQEASAYVASESKLEHTTLAPPEPSSAAPSPSKSDSPGKEQKIIEPSMPSAVISRVQQSSSPAEFPPANEPSIQPKPTHTASAFAREKLPESQKQQPKSTQIKSVPRPPRPLPDSFHTDERMSSSKQMTYKVFSSWLDAPGMQDHNGNKAKGKHDGTVSTRRRENKGAISASELTFNQNKKMLSTNLFDKSQVKKTPFALAASEGLTGEMNHRPNAFPNKPDIRYSNTVNTGNVRTLSGNQINNNNDITITPMPLTEKQQRPHDVVSVESLTQANSGYQQLVRQSQDFQSIKPSESSRQKITTSPRTKVTLTKNVGMRSDPSTSNTKINQVYRAEERRYAGNKRIPTNTATQSEEMLMSVASQTASVVGNIQEPTDISAHSKAIPQFVAHETSSLIASKERKGQIEPHKLFGTQRQNVSALAELRRVQSLNKIPLQDSENVNPWNIKNDILQKNFQNLKRRNKKDFVLDNYRAQAGDNSKTITKVFNTQPRTAEGPQKKNFLEPKHKVIESPKRISNAGHIDTEFSGQDLLRKYNKPDKIIGQTNQSLVYFSPTGHLYSKTENVILKQQDGNNAIATEKQNTLSGSTRQGNQARLIEDVNQQSQSKSTWQYNSDDISSSQVNEGIQTDFVWQGNQENIKSTVNKGRKNSNALRDKQESVVNQGDEALIKRVAYSNSGDSRDVLKAESQTSARSEAVSPKGYSAGPIKKPCDVVPVCGSDGFTYMSECFIWS